jgi:hypothetical protein
VVTLTPEERRQRYKLRHGGVCVDCGALTSLTRKGAPSARCAACHAAYVDTGHGLARYNHAGCRCDVCRQANTDHAAARRNASRVPCPECGANLILPTSRRCLSCHGRAVIAGRRRDWHGRLVAGE